MPLNQVWVKGRSMANTCVGNGSWAAVPSLTPVSIKTNGRPVMLHAQVRQYKTVSCAQRGHLTVRLDGTILVDPSGLGMASTYECNAVATLNTMLSLDAGTHTLELVEMGDNGGVCTYGTFDFLHAYELPN